MTAKAATDAPANTPRDAAEAPARPADAITGWLDMLDALLRLPPRDRAEIRDELESHLRDRTHDLMLAGLDADQAARRATTELGETAELAGRFHESRTHTKRRHLMNMMGIGMAAAAVAVSVTTLVLNSGAPRLQVVASSPASIEAQPAGDGNYMLHLEPHADGKGNLTVVPVLGKLPIIANYFKPTTPGATPTPENEQSLRDQLLAAQQRTEALQAFVQTLLAGADPHGGTPNPDPANAASPPPVVFDTSADRSLSGKVFSVNFKETPLRDALEFVAKVLDRTLALDQTALDGIGLAPDASVTLAAKDIDAPRFFELLRRTAAAAAPDSHPNKLAYRAGETLLEVSTADEFDRREVILSAYAIDDLMRIPDLDTEGLTNTLRNLVYADGWESNGGSLARAYIAGRTLFIEAPNRYHQKIQWILGQIRTGGAPWLTDQPEKPKAASDPAPAPQTVERYALQHVLAADALETIKKLMSIRRVDFTGFTVDQHTNSIVGRASADDQDLVKGAIQDLDRPEARPDAAHGK